MPITIKAEPSALWNGVRSLFSDSTSTSFSDIQIAGTHVSKCFLAAAAQSTSIQEALIEAECNEVPSQSSRGLLELVLGQEVTLKEHDEFFRLFSLAQKLQWRGCMDVCKEIIAKSKHEQLPIALKLSAEQGVRMLSFIHAHSAQWPGDAIVKIRKAENQLDSSSGVPSNPESCSTGGERSETMGSSDCSSRVAAAPPASCPNIQVHRAILAASCDYVRGLWCGAFSESASRSEPLELQLDEADVKPFRALLKIVYGGSVDLPIVDEVVDLFRFADRWQCNSVKNQALVQILSNLSHEKAVSILDNISPLPSELLRACAQTIDRSRLQAFPVGAALCLLEGAADLKSHNPLLKTAADKVLADLGECCKGFTWAVKCMNNATTIANAGIDKDVLNTASVWSAKMIGQFQKEEAWLQIQPEAMIGLLLELSRQGRMDSLSARHTLRWAHEWSSVEFAEHIPLLVWVAASALKSKSSDFKVLIGIIFEEIATGDTSPAIVSAMLNSISNTSDSHCSEAQVVEDTAGQTAKRRRVAKLLSAPFVAREVPRDFLKQWLSVDERYELFCGSSSWKQLSPAALLEAISLAPEQAKLDSAIAIWVRCARMNDVFDAVLVPNRGPANAIKLLQDSARQRFSALSESRHQEDIAKAVEAERVVSRAAAAVEKARLQKQYDERIAALETALRVAGSHIEKALKDTLLCGAVDSSSVKTDVAQT